MTTKTPSSHPTHRVCVVENAGEKSYWTDIGVGFEHRDGKGINCKLPPGVTLSGGFVIRAVEPKDAEGGDQ